MNTINYKKLVSLLLTISILSCSAGFGGRLLANRFFGEKNNIPVAFNATPVSLSSTSFNAVTVAERCADSVVEIRTKSV